MEDRVKAVKKYNQLKEKYGLPSLSELEKTFDFELEDTSGILRRLIMIIWEAVHKVRNYAESMLNPQRYCCFFETKFFNKKEKEKIFDVYSEIMEAYWKTERFHYQTAKERAESLKQGYALFKKLKSFFEEFTGKLSKEWSKKEKKSKEEREYIT